MTSKDAQFDVVVVGGGLSGLAAATYLARAGRRVVVCERAGAPGGRAGSQDDQGFIFNQGPHALYKSGCAEQVLAELGVTPAGKLAPTSGVYGIKGGVKHTFPVGVMSMLTTGLLRLPAKFEVARLLGGLRKLDPEPLHGVTVRAWVEEHLADPVARELVYTLIRVATYAAAPERQSMGSAVANLQLALENGVLYLDGGWQTLVDGLRAAAAEAGVEVRVGAKVAAVEVAGDVPAVRGVRLASGELLAADAVLISGGPRTAAALAPSSPALRALADAAEPVRAACLDVALSSLPRRRALVALGVDEPLYLSVHSATARLAPEGGAFIHVAKYLSGEPGPGDQKELEGALDLMQPGWRELVVARRFLPALVACHALDRADAGGRPGRPGPAVSDVAGLYIAGDWVGPDGLLADAALASAKRAAELISARIPARLAA